jgi:hypothetical protein
MKRDLKYWADTCAGVFWIAALTVGLMLLVGSTKGAAAPGLLVGLLCVLALAGLVGWTWCAFKLASRSTLDKVFPHG